ncbi:MAG TPA: FmdB family transcriptional regulator [Ilumatobacteraceae bacterium]|nr:FmdB family transcriptional regulator [Ilumatobacteraceae bacterium]
MPTYVYKFVDTGETIEVQQGFHDDNLTEIAHPDTGKVLPVRKVFTPVGVTFKGSGFFKTDNRGKKSSGTTSSGESSSGSSDSGSGGTKDAAAASTSSSSESSSSKSSGSESSGSKSSGSKSSGSKSSSSSD